MEKNVSKTINYNNPESSGGGSGFLFIERRIMFNSFKRQLLLKKRKALYEAEMDLVYFYTTQDDLIKKNTKELRSKLQAEKEKKKPDNNIINNLSGEITDAESVQSKVMQIEYLVVELKKYIKIISSI